MAKDEGRLYENPAHCVHCLCTVLSGGRSKNKVLHQLSQVQREDTRRQGDAAQPAISLYIIFFLLSEAAVAAYQKAKF